MSGVRGLVFITRGALISIKRVLFTNVLFTDLNTIVSVTVSIATTYTRLRQRGPSVDHGTLFATNVGINHSIVNAVSAALVLTFFNKSLNM